VLDATEARLLEQGADGVSVRAVAEALGMSVGNLQYYFPTRAALLDAVFRRHADRFRDDLAALVTTGMQPRAVLAAVVDHWLATQARAEQRLFWSLWAISAHDDAARATMTSVYRELLDFLAAQLRALHPTLSRDESVRRAAAIAALVDGASLYVGFGRRPSRALRRLHDEVRADVALIIERPAR
jgi:AcrR family transcriptional regulator